MSLITKNSVLQKNFSAAETWKGQSVPIADTTRILHINVETTTPGVLKIWHSVNNNVWDTYGDIYQITGHKSLELTPKARFFYLEYTNGATPGTVNVATMFFNNLSLAVSSQLGSKGNIHNGVLAQESDTAHFNVHEYGVNSVITATIEDIIAVSGTLDIFGTSSPVDAPGTGVYLGSISMIKQAITNKAHGVVKCNLSAFDYIWVQNQLGLPLTEVDVIISAYDYQS